MATHPQPLTLELALLLYEREYLASHNLAPATRLAYLRSLRELTVYLQEQGLLNNVSDVERRHLEGYLGQLDSRGLSGSYRRRYVAAFRSFFAFLEERGHVSPDPARKLIPPRRAQNLPRYLTEPEYKRLLEAVRYEPRDAAMVELLLQTGMRVSELAGLQLSDIQLPTKITKEPDNAGSATINGKGRRQRTVTLNWKACKALKAYLAVRAGDTGYSSVFLTKFRSGISPRSIERALEKHLAEAGIRGATVHTMRHTFGTHSAKKGMKLRVLQEVLGHSSLDTTTIYVSLAREDMDRQMQENAL